MFASLLFLSNGLEMHFVDLTLLVDYLSMTSFRLLSLLPVSKILLPLFLENLSLDLFVWSVHLCVWDF